MDHRAVVGEIGSEAADKFGQDLSRAVRWSMTQARQRLGWDDAFPEFYSDLVARYLRELIGSRMRRDAERQLGELRSPVAAAFVGEPSETEAAVAEPAVASARTALMTMAPRMTAPSVPPRKQHVPASVAAAYRTLLEEHVDGKRLGDYLGSDLQAFVRTAKKQLVGQGKRAWFMQELAKRVPEEQRVRDCLAVEEVARLKLEAERLGTQTLAAALLA